MVDILELGDLAGAWPMLLEASSSAGAYLTSRADTGVVTIGGPLEALVSELQDLRLLFGEVSCFQVESLRYHACSRAYQTQFEVTRLLVSEGLESGLTKEKNGGLTPLTAAIKASVTQFSSLASGEELEAAVRSIRGMPIVSIEGLDDVVKHRLEEEAATGREEAAHALMGLVEVDRQSEEEEESRLDQAFVSDLWSKLVRKESVMPRAGLASLLKPVRLMTGSWCEEGWKNLERGLLKEAKVAGLLEEKEAQIKAIRGGESVADEMALAVEVFESRGVIGGETSDLIDGFIDDVLAGQELRAREIEIWLERLTSSGLGLLEGGGPILEGLCLFLESTLHWESLERRRISNEAMEEAAELAGKLHRCGGLSVRVTTGLGVLAAKLEAMVEGHHRGEGDLILAIERYEGVHQGLLAAMKNAEKGQAGEMKNDAERLKKALRLSHEASNEAQTMEAWHNGRASDRMNLELRGKVLLELHDLFKGLEGDKAPEARSPRQESGAAEVVVAAMAQIEEGFGSSAELLTLAEGLGRLGQSLDLNSQFRESGLAVRLQELILSSGPALLEAELVRCEGGLKEDLRGISKQRIALPEGLSAAAEGLITGAVLAIGLKMERLDEGSLWGALSAVRVVSHHVTSNHVLHTGLLGLGDTIVKALMAFKRRSELRLGLKVLNEAGEIKITKEEILKSGLVLGSRLREKGLTELCSRLGTLNEQLKYLSTEKGALESSNIELFIEILREAVSGALVGSSGEDCEDYEVYASAVKSLISSSVHIQGGRIQCEA